MSFVTFLGTGSSTGVPRVACLLNPQSKCRVCPLAHAGDPATNPNYRTNPSLLITVAQEGGAPSKSIVIDTGKSFRESALRWFPRYGVQGIDAILLTHHHADATFGLDDVRGMQRVVKNGRRYELEATPLYLGLDCSKHLRSTFPYLFPGPVSNPQTSLRKQKKQQAKVFRKVSNFDVQLLEHFAPSQVCGLDIVPLPLIHGKDCISLGFAFGRIRRRTVSGCSNSYAPNSSSMVVYFSDVSEIPKETEEWCVAHGPVDVLVLDALFKHVKHNTHFNLEQALVAVKRMKPRKTFLVGMSDNFEYFQDNLDLASDKQLQELGLTVQLAHDGLRLPCNL